MSHHSTKSLAPIQVSSELIIPVGSIVKINICKYTSEKVAEGKPITRIYYQINGGVTIEDSFYSTETLIAAWQEALK